MSRLGRFLNRGDRMANLIALGAVSSTMLGALIGLAQSRASDRASRASDAAQDHYVHASAAFDRGQHDAREQYGLFVLGEAARNRAASALEVALFGDSRLDRRQLQLDRRRELAAASESERSARRLAAAGSVPFITPAAAFGPARDTAFPNTFFALAAREGNRLTALGDTANEESSRRSSQVSAYTVMLTMLTVAVFLFGFALTPEGQENRALFAGVAACLAVIAVVWSIGTTTQFTKRAPDDAARAYADAQVALAAHDWHRAIDLTSRAIELRPGFARAYGIRAQAWFASGAPHGPVSPSLTSPDARRHELADLEKVKALGANDVTAKLGSDQSAFLTSVGYEALALGIDEASTARIRQGLSLSKQAVEADPSDPTAAYNVGLAELALGDRRAAFKAYAAAVTKTQFTDAAHRHRRNQYDQQLQVSGALTDLEYARRLGRQQLQRDVDSLKQFVVGSIEARKLMAAPPPPASPTIRGIEVEVDPARVFVRVPGNRVPHARVSVQVYHHERGGLGWSALPEISGSNASPYNANGEFAAAGIYLSSSDPPSCLPNGIYRVELYVDGRLAGVKEVTGVFGDLVAATDRDVGYALCRLPGWRPRARRAAEPGLASGFVSPDGTQSVDVLSVHAGSKRGERPAAARARALRTIERAAVPILHLHLRHGKPLGYAVFGDGFGEYAAGREYVVGSRTVRAGYGVRDDGSILAAIVVGPTKNFNQAEPDEDNIFSSIVYYDPSEYVIPPF